MRKRALGKIAAICSLFLPLNYVEAATYGSGACPNTQKNWRSFDRSFEFPNWNFIQIEEHRYRWNDQPASKNELIGYLKQIPQLDPQPLIILIPSKAATCEAVIRARLVMERLLNCSKRSGLCGEGRAFAPLVAQSRYDRKLIAEVAHRSGVNHR